MSQTQQLSRLEELAVQLVLRIGKRVPEVVKHWPIPDGIVYTIGLLREADKNPTQTADIVVKLLEGENAYNTIQRYSERFGHVREEIKANEPEVYAKLMGKFATLITPALIEDAVEDIKRDRVILGGTTYSRLNKIKEGLDSGKLEAELRRELDISGWEIRQTEFGVYDPLESALSQLRGYDRGKEGANSALNFFYKDQLPNLVKVLNDFEAELGAEQFGARGYLRAREMVTILASEIEEMHRYVIDKLSAREIKLIADREQKQREQRYIQQPTLLQRFGTFLQKVRIR